jgi:hypothetical protein
LEREARQPPPMRWIWRGRERRRRRDEGEGAGCACARVGGAGPRVGFVGVGNIYITFTANYDHPIAR